MNYGFSNKMKNDKRGKKWKKQRRKRGFDDTEIWDLHSSICKFILPRLKRFKKCIIGYPARLTMKKWKNILQKMIDGFEEYVKNDNLGDMKKVEQGRKLFNKYFYDLWW